MTEKSITLLSPAKINLCLSITGQREDGFHEISSLVLPLNWGDRVSIQLFPDKNPKQDEVSFSNQLKIKNDLASQAIQAFRNHVDCPGAILVQIDKHIPMGAGLGGGSSNASTVLLGLNKLMGDPLSFEKLSLIASQLGSDCPLFLHNKPVIIRGRGEKISQIDPGCLAWMKGMTVLLFKPDFSISTINAYSAMASAKGSYYSDSKNAKSAIDGLTQGKEFNPKYLINDLQAPAFKEHPLLESTLQHVRSKWDIPCLMSGSGSACFALIENEDNTALISREIQEKLGHNSWTQICQYCT